MAFSDKVKNSQFFKRSTSRLRNLGGKIFLFRNAIRLPQIRKQEWRQKKEQM
jgi:hypothetical protein